jgi:hypothetical protein
MQLERPRRLRRQGLPLPTWGTLVTTTAMARIWRERASLRPANTATRKFGERACGTLFNSCPLIFLTFEFRT